MDKKILLQEIADILAEKEGITRKKAENFTRAFFEIIEEGLTEDKFVKVKGFGTFKVIPVSERESVDINTGERIQISGHSKITFTPDNFLKDLVNKPFSHFQTVVINEDTDIEELESIPTPEEDSYDNENKTTDKEEIAQVSSESVIAIEEETFLPEKETGEQAFTATTDDVLNIKKEEEFITEMPEETEGTKEDIQEEVAIPTQEESKISLEKVSQAVPEVEHPSELIRSEKDLHNTEPFEKENDNIKNTDNLSHDNIQYVIKEVPSHKEKNRWKLIALMLFILILMGLSYFAGYFRVFCPCELISSPTVTQKRTTPSVAKKSVQDISTTKNLPQKDTAFTENTVVGTNIKKDTITTTKHPAPQKESNKKETPVKVFVVAKGDNIYSIAKKTYGHKSYATYIIKYNNLKDPDNIIIGSTLKLPDLSSDKE